MTVAEDEKHLDIIWARFQPLEALIFGRIEVTLAVTQFRQRQTALDIAPGSAPAPRQLHSARTASPQGLNRPVLSKVDPIGFGLLLYSRIEQVDGLCRISLFRDQNFAFH